MNNSVSNYINSSCYKEHTPKERKSIIADIKAGKLNRDHASVNDWTDKDKKDYENYLREKGHGGTIDSLRKSFPKAAFDIVNDSFEKIANTMEFKTGDFKSSKEGQTTKGFRSGSFEKVEPKKSNPVIISTVNPQSQTRKTFDIPAPPKSKNKPESRNATDIYRDVRTSVLSVSTSDWYRSLPKSLRDNIDNELEHQSYQLISDGLGPRAASMVIKSNMKAALSDEVVEKYKYIDTIQDKIYSSSQYSDEYSKGTARKSGPKWGAGIGAGVGTGIGALIGQNRAGAALLGAGVGAGFGALTGYVSGVDTDRSNAFDVAKKHIEPGYDRLSKDAYKMLSKRLA